jgi:hypothetical protein
MELYRRLHGVIYRKTQKYWSVPNGQLSERTMSKSRIGRVFVSVGMKKSRRWRLRPGLANLWHAAFTAVPIFVFPLPDQRLYIVKSMYIYTLVPVAARSKAWVYGRPPAEIVGSNPTGAWMSVCCECCVLSRRGLCDELITRREESYRLWCVVCDLEKQTS